MLTELDNPPQAEKRPATRLPVMISITVPVYNERESLPALLPALTGVLDRIGRPWEVVLVNDGSTDGSDEVLDGLAAADPRVKVVHFRRNFGQTAAMMAGIDFASGEIIIPIDADLQNDPEDIPRLLEKLDEGYDVCSGWRKDRQDEALRRNLPSRIANRLISWVSGISLHDYGCSLKAYRRDVIKGVKLYGEMHRFVPIYAAWQGAKVAEIPVRHHARKFGTSKYGLERVVKVVLDLMVVTFLDRYARKPIYVFGGIGIACLGVGVLAGAWALVLKYFHGISLIQTPLPLMVVMMGITGILCILMGFLAEIITRTWHESQNMRIYLVRNTRNVEASAQARTA